MLRFNRKKVRGTNHFGLMARTTKLCGGWAEELRSFPLWRDCLCEFFLNVVVLFFGTAVGLRFPADNAQPPGLVHSGQPRTSLCQTSGVLEASLLSESPKCQSCNFVLPVSVSLHR